MSDVTIIGAGPAGIATAIQLKRQGINPVIIEKNSIGGLARNASLIENYLGFPSGITGEEFIKLLQEQVYSNNIKILNEEVINVSHTENFVIKTNRSVIESRILVIASGTKSQRLETEIPKNCENKVFYEVYPIKHLEGKEISIIGSGDASFDYAVTLAKKNKVSILIRKNPKCNQALMEKVSRIRNINLKYDCVVSKIECLNDKLMLSGEIPADNLVIAIGRKPEIGFLDNGIINNINKLQNKGLLFMAGDVKNDKYRQISISTGDGIMAAMQIYRQLQAR